MRARILIGADEGYDEWDDWGFSLWCGSQICLMVPSTECIMAGFDLSFFGINIRNTCTNKFKCISMVSNFEQLLDLEYVSGSVI